MSRISAPGTSAATWRPPRLVLCLVALALFAGVASGCTVLQYNIANGNIDDPPDQRRGQDDVIDRVRAGFRPQLITLNEVCTHRLWEIMAELAPHGYRQVFHGKPGCNAPGRLMGNAIIFAGQPVGPDYVHTFRCQGKNVRTAIGQQIRAGHIRYLAWVTHLDNSARADCQARELLDVVRFIGTAEGLPSVVGGDFNLPPSHAAMKLWYQRFTEADGSLKRATHRNGTKIDYIFATMPLERLADIRAGHSDHHMLTGYFR